MKRSIVQVVVGLPVEGPFDYLVEDAFKKKIAVGQRVKVSFNRQKRIGYVIGFKKSSPFKVLNPILDVLDETPIFDERTLAFTKEFAQYYGCSWGEAIETSLPSALRGFYKTSVPFIQTDPLAEKTPRAILIHDQGLNKRWEEIKRIIKESLATQKSVLFLLPEKAYIDDVLKQLDELKDKLCIIKEKMAIAQERQQWEALKTKGPFVVVGTRRAIFSPVRALGAIVIYEEENYGYRQDQSPNYHVNEVAFMRQRFEGGDVVFVSSSPTAEIWKEADESRWQKITLTESLAPVQLIDMSNYNPGRSSILSFPLQNNLHQALDNRKKTLLFMNRRGFFTLTRCNQCAFTVRCPRCDVNLSYTYSKKKLVCRHCNFTTDLPKICPQCGGAYLRSLGTGVEKLESEVARFYPQAAIAHFDKESRSIPSKADVIIATQAVLKLRGVLKPDIVCVLNFDAEFSHTDFRSAQRAFSLLVHLGQMAKEKLIVQTRNTDNYCLKAAQKWDFERFYEEELKLRKDLLYPPYAHLLGVNVRGKKEDVVASQSQKLYELLQKNSQEGIEISEPMIDFMPKLRDQYRYTIMGKGLDLKAMMDLARKSVKALKKRSVIITLTVDP